MTALIVASILTVSTAPQRLLLEPPARSYALTIDPEAAERIHVNPILAAPAVILLALPLTVDVLIGQFWLAYGPAVGQWHYAGYGLLSFLPVIGPWTLYLLNGETPFGWLWGNVIQPGNIRRGVLIDAAAQTVGALFLVSSFLIPGPRDPGDGFRLEARGLTWRF